MSGSRRQRMRELGAPVSGSQIHVVERADAVGHWFPFSYMVRSPDGDWQDCETLTAAHEHIRTSRTGSAALDSAQRDFAEQLESMFPRT
jgi:hypothetical protein